MTRNIPVFGAILALGLGLGLSACSSGPDAKPDKTERQERISTPYQAEKPSAEELAKSPCGNPDWAQLPPGAQKTSEAPEATEPVESELK